MPAGQLRHGLGKQLEHDQGTVHRIFRKLSPAGGPLRPSAGHAQATAQKGRHATAAAGQPFLMGGGIETTPVFLQGVELRDFAAFELFETAEGRMRLDACYPVHAGAERFRRPLRHRHPPHRGHRAHRRLSKETDHANRDRAGRPGHRARNCARYREAGGGRHLVQPDPATPEADVPHWPGRRGFRAPAPGRNSSAPPMPPRRKWRRNSPCAK